MSKILQVGAEIEGGERGWPLDGGVGVQGAGREGGVQARGAKDGVLEEEGDRSADQQVCLHSESCEARC